MEIETKPYESTDEMIWDYKSRFGVKVNDYEMPLIWVKNKTNGSKVLLSAYSESTVRDNLNLNSLLADWVYLDGSPCGIRVFQSEDNGEEIPF